MGEDPPSMVCTACPKGQTSSDGTPKNGCRTCAKGTFSIKDGAKECTKCPANWYQPQEEVASIQCISCPAGYFQEKTGESSCFDPGGIKPDNCGDDEYWVDNKENSNKAGCLVCPPGGSCIGPVKEADINTLFGWSKCPHSNLTYSQCAFGAACNGAKNDLLINKYLNEFGEDPATMNHNASCSTFYKNNSLLCAACADGYSKGGGSNKCK